MAAITGVTGDCEIPTAAGGINVGIFRWSANIQREVFDVTGFDDSGNARIKVGGLYHLVGTCEAYGQDTIPTLGTMEDDDATATPTFVLTSSAGDTYTFAGILTDVGPTVEKKGVGTTTMTFESSGAVVVVEGP